MIITSDGIIIHSAFYRTLILFRLVILKFKAMLKKYPVLKWSLLTFTALIVLLLSFGFWFMSLLPSSDPNVDITATRVSDLPYLSENIVPNRGKILAVVTSTDVMGNSGKRTGYELTELSRTYYVFEANGFEMDIASPKGGKPTGILDKDDMAEYDYAFLNDSQAQEKVRNTIPIKDIDPQEYDAIFFAGGKGAMFDFPENEDIQRVVRDLYQSDKVIGAVCHGPAALVNVLLDNGRPLIENKEVSGFTNSEELLLIPDAESIFPYLLQDKLSEQGARFNEGVMYLDNVSHDGNLITGQNPWSTWTMAEAMVTQLGYAPKYRETSGEENAVKVLQVYFDEGSDKAKELIFDISTVQKEPLSRQLIAMHGIVAAMQGEIGRFFSMVRLTSYANSVSENM